MFNFNFKDIDFAHKLDYASSPLDEYDKHIHVFYELLYFLKGDVDYHVEGETKHLKNGDIILIAPGKIHFAEVNKNVSYERYVLKFPGSIVNDNLKTRLDAAFPFFSMNSYVDQALRNLDHYYDAFNDEDMYQLSICKITEALIYLANIRQNNLDYTSNDLITNIISYIQIHIKDNLTLHQLSTDLNYSESYISNQFKEIMKCSIIKYIRSKKIILAQQMIKEGKKAIDVAEELSFNDYSTFYRTYLKIIGTSPNEDKEH